MSFHLTSSFFPHFILIMGCDSLRSKLFILVKLQIQLVELRKKRSYGGDSITLLIPMPKPKPKLLTVILQTQWRKGKGGKMERENLYFSNLKNKTGTKDYTNPEGSKLIFHLALHRLSEDKGRVVKNTNRETAFT